MEKHVYCYNNLVIGGSLNALLFAYATETPIVIDEMRKPFEFDRIENQFDFLNFTNETELKLDVWERLRYLLSMSGLLMNPMDIQNWRTENNKIIFITSGNKKITINSQSHLIFDKKAKGAYVYDWFDVRSGGIHDYDFLEDKESNFIQKILFFPSKRAHVKTTKDAVSISHLSEEQLEDIEYSEGVARLKTLKMMKAAGIRGAKNGFTKTGIQNRYAAKIEHSYREVKNKYEYHMSVEKILKLINKEGALCKLTKRLFMPKEASI